MRSGLGIFGVLFLFPHFEIGQHNQLEATPAKNGGYSHTIQSLYPRHDHVVYLSGDAIPILCSPSQHYT